MASQGPPEDQAADPSGQHEPPATEDPEPVEQVALLEALDDHPATPKELSRVLPHGQEAIQAALLQAEADGMAVDWGGVWATTWTAKRQLEPSFFGLWIPLSLALGATVTVLALTLHTDGTNPALLVALVLVATGALGTLAVTRGSDS